MFGYIVMNKPEIKFKRFLICTDLFYCGFAQRNSKSKIWKYQDRFLLTYDMTFVVILLSALYESPTQKGKHKMYHSSSL